MKVKKGLLEALEVIGLAVELAVDLYVCAHKMLAAWSVKRLIPVSLIMGIIFFVWYFTVFAHMVNPGWDTTQLFAAQPLWLKLGIVLYSFVLMFEALFMWRFEMEVDKEE